MELKRINAETIRRGHEALDILASWCPADHRSKLLRAIRAAMYPEET